MSGDEATIVSGATNSLLARNDIMDPYSKTLCITVTLTNNDSI